MLSSDVIKIVRHFTFVIILDHYVYTVFPWLSQVVYSVVSEADDLVPLPGLCVSWPWRWRYSQSHRLA